MDAAPPLNLLAITAEQAAEALAGIETLDPAGMIDAEGVRAMCLRGACFVLTDGRATGAVCVVRQVNGVLWVGAAMGHGPVDLTAALDDVLTERATVRGIDAMAFQTARPGLVRKMQKRGYQITGWIMKKSLK